MSENNKKSHSKKKLFLIDGSSYIYRAFFALPHLSNSKGLPTNAVYGFTSMLLKVIREKNPDYLAVTFDAKGPTFRHEVYKEYPNIGLTTVYRTLELLVKLRISEKFDFGQMLQLLPNNREGLYAHHLRGPLRDALDIPGDLVLLRNTEGGFALLQLADLADLAVLAAFNAVFPSSTCGIFCRCHMGRDPLGAPVSPLGANACCLLGRAGDEPGTWHPLQPSAAAALRSLPLHRSAASCEHSGLCRDRPS